MMQLATTLPDWSKKFQPPIPVQSRVPLRTLKDAGQFILALSPAERQTARWQAASEILRMIAERGGDLTIARLAIVRALHSRDAASRPARRRAMRYTTVLG